MTTAPLSWPALTHAQRLSTLLPLVATHTAKTAAQRLGTTRNAIAGFAARQGLVFLGGAVKAVGANDNHARRAPARRLFAEQYAGASFQGRPHGLNIPLLALADHQCKWPTTGTGASQLFCGLPSGRRSYCPTHRHATSPRPKDKAYSAALFESKPIAPGITPAEAVALVRGKEKMEGCE